MDGVIWHPTVCFGSNIIEHILSHLTVNHDLWKNFMRAQDSDHRTLYKIVKYMKNVSGPSELEYSGDSKIDYSLQQCQKVIAPAHLINRIKL